MIASRYEPLREISGGMGRILICRDGKSGAVRALKTIRADAVTADNKSALSEEATTWLRLGAVDLGNFFVPLEQVFMSRGELYLVMPYYERGSLRSVYAAGPSQVVKVTWLTHILLGLWQIAEKGIVHCDLKPENVLIDDEGRARISDFGISRAFQRNASGYLAHRTTSLRGTLPYMAPEQLTTGRLDTRTDMWAFAVLAIEVMTDVHPFALGHADDIAAAIVGDSERYLQPVLALLPEQMEGFLRRLLARESKDRPADFGDVLDLWAEVVGVAGAHRQPSDPLAIIEDGAVLSAWNVAFFPSRPDRDAVRIKYAEIDAIPQAESLYRLDRFEDAISRANAVLFYDAGDGSALDRFLLGDLPTEDYSRSDRDDPGRVIILPGRSAIYGALSVRLRSAVALLAGGGLPEPSEHLQLCEGLLTRRDLLPREIQRYVAQILGMSSCFREARTLLSQLLSENPKDVSAWNTLFTMAVLEGGDDRSIAHEVARSAIGALGQLDEVRAAYVLAHMCSVVGHHELAVQFAGSAFMQDDDDMDSLFLLIANLWNSGDRDRARDFYLDLVEMAPQSQQRERLRPLFER